MPLPLEDEGLNTPVAVIPESLTRYLFPEEMQPNGIRETDDDANDSDVAAEETAKRPSKQKNSTDKRKHVFTGQKPPGRPKSGAKGSQ